MPTGSRRVVLGVLVRAASVASMSAQAPGGPAAAARAQANVRQALQRALDTDKMLRTPERIRLVRRGFGDPLPIE